MTNRRYAGRILMIRNKSLGKRLLAAGIMLIFSMSGCGTDNEIELTGNGIGSDGIEAAATVDSAELTAAGETASDVTGGDAASTGTAEDTNKTAPTPAPAPWQELTTADRMADRTKVKGIYVTGPKAGSTGMEDLIGLVDETELNAMVIDVKNDEGNVTFRLTNEEITQNIPLLDQISEMQAGVRYIRDIQALMQELKDHNIYTIARIVCFKDPILAAARPELALTKPDGKPVTDANGLAWVNPYRQEVWEYLTMTTILHLLHRQNLPRWQQTLDSMRSSTIMCVFRWDQMPMQRTTVWIWMPIRRGRQYRIFSPMQETDFTKRDAWLRRMSSALSSEVRPTCRR